MNGVWAPRDLEIVETLNRKVRLLALEQIAGGWWPGAGSLRAVRSRLQRLVAGGLLVRTVVNAHPLLSAARPLAAWRPGEEHPDFEAVSHAARSRWTEAAVPLEVFFAGRLAANLFGSTAGDLPAWHHRDHDLLLGQVYIHYRTRRTDESARWVGEDSLPKAGYRIKDPDAFLIDPAGRVQCVIESAGRYSPEQVESFHEHCHEHDLPYEIW
jgi:hypothetical protein